MPCSLFVSTESYYLISNQTTFFTRYQALCWKSRKQFWFDISFRMIRSVQKTCFTNYQQNTNKNVYQIFGQLSTKYIQMPQTNTKKTINLLNSIFKWALCSKSRKKFWFDISFRMIRSVQKTCFTNYQQNTNKNAYQLFGQLSTKFIQMPQTSTKKAINLLNSIFKWTLSLTSHGQLCLLRCWFVPL